MIFKPSDSELEIMQILWEKGPLTVREVNEFLNLQRRVGYTTTLKIMQIMSEKKMLIRDTRQRSHIYSPTVEPGDIQTNILDHVIKTAFRGSTTSLVLRALGNNSASPAEMKEIKALIEEMEKKSHGTI
jgi:BlaI family penicillinase repressor